MSYPLGKYSCGQRADSEPPDVDGRRDELRAAPARLRSTNRAQFCHGAVAADSTIPTGTLRRSVAPRASSQALRREEHERAEDREANRWEEQTPAPIPVAQMTREQQRANAATAYTAYMTVTVNSEK
ncbi:MAG: hypothetical protein ACLP01_09520 [Solirubrobacteraceae bacterium]